MISSYQLVHSGVGQEADVCVNVFACVCTWIQGAVLGGKDEGASMWWAEIHTGHCSSLYKVKAWFKCSNISMFLWISVLKDYIRNNISSYSLWASLSSATWWCHTQALNVSTDTWGGLFLPLLLPPSRFLPLSGASEKMSELCNWQPREIFFFSFSSLIVSMRAKHSETMNKPGEGAASV